MQFQFILSWTGEKFLVRWQSPCADNGDVRERLEALLRRALIEQGGFFGTEPWEATFAYHPGTHIRADRGLPHDALAVVTGRIGATLAVLWASHHRFAAHGLERVLERSRRMVRETFKDLVRRELNRDKPERVMPVWYVCEVTAGTGGPEDALATVREDPSRHNVILLPLLDADDPFWPHYASLCRMELARCMLAVFDEALDELVAEERRAIAEAERRIRAIRGIHTPCTGA